VEDFSEDMILRKGRRKIKISGKNLDLAIYYRK
jgi:hypothetical protein